MTDSERHPTLFDAQLAPVRFRRRRLGHADIEAAPVRDILTRATGFMDAYDFTINPYAGCSFGCTYCYAAFFLTVPRNAILGDGGSRSRRTRLIVFVPDVRVSMEN